MYLKCAAVLSPLTLASPALASSMSLNRSLADDVRGWISTSRLAK